VISALLHSKRVKLISAICLGLVLCLSLLSRLLMQKPYQAHATGSVSYHTSGKQILDDQNHVYIPYGVFVGGILLADKNWNQPGHATTHVTQDTVQAAHDFWYSNMISLALAYDPLFPNGANQPPDSNYVAFVDEIVGWANALNMNVDIVDEEQATHPPVSLPTINTMNFWNYMSTHYKNNPRVFFDLFNEPNIWHVGLTEPAGNNASTCPSSEGGTQAFSWDDACAWSYWKNGTTQGGVTYYGMDQIAHEIRQNGAQNLIIAQGLASGEDIADLANTYTPERGAEFLLTVPNVVYAVHPYFSSQHDTVTQWDNWFGHAVSAGNFPVFVSEWGLDQEAASGCEANSTTEIPLISTFFRYILSKNMGLVGWALQPGDLIEGWDVRDPTTFPTSTMPANCSEPPFNTDPTAQGVGQLLQLYLATHSVQS